MQRRKHDEHQQLLKATLARDTERAVDLLRGHIGRTEQLVAATLAGSASADQQQPLFRTACGHADAAVRGSRSRLRPPPG